MVDPRMIQIPFGPGLDKETGAMVARPGSMLDLRNVYHHEGSLAVRHGMEKKIQFTDYVSGEDATHILAGIAIRSERVGIVVSFYEPTGHVTINRVDGTASYGIPLGNWPYDLDADEVPTLAWPTANLPKIILEEIYGQVYFAHDERYLSRRAPTWVYDPYFTYSDSGGLAVLKGLLTTDHRLSAEAVHELPVTPGVNPDSSAEFIRFRGVSRHMDYLFGWGYGNRTVERPEMVRVSYPGEPRRWHPEHYFVAGDRRDPVISCEPARQTMLVFKETDTHQIFGYSRATFGIRPFDQLYGCLAGRLAQTVSGQVFFWSAEGPRVASDMGPSEKIHLPLDLGGFEPATLVARTEFPDGWCDFIDETESLYFGFGQRLYVLSLRNPADPRWTYWELARKAYCGFRLYGDTGGPPPDGYPDNLAFVGPINEDAGCQWPGAIISFDNNDQQDGDLIDIWVKPNTPRWTKVSLIDETLVGDGANMPIGWTIDLSQQGTAFEYHRVQGENWQVNVSGTSAVDDEVSAYLVYTTGVTVGEDYRFECDLKAFWPYTQVRTHGTFLRMEFLSAADAVLATHEQVMNQGDYNRTFVYGTAPATTTKIRVRFGGSVAAGGECYGQFRRPALYGKESAGWQKIDLGRPAPEVSAETSQHVSIYKLTEPGMEYEAAARYTNAAGMASLGYQGSPDTWPAESKFTFDCPIAPPGIGVVRSDPHGELRDVWERFFKTDVACGLTYGGPGGDTLIWQTPPKYANRDIEMSVKVITTPVTGYPDLCRGAASYRFYVPYDINPTVFGGIGVQFRYLGPDVNSEWGPTVVLDAEDVGTQGKPTVALTSPPGGSISANWGWGTDAPPSGYLRGLEVQTDYDGVSAPGDWRTIFNTCGEPLWDPQPVGVCLGTLPNDPYVFDLPGTYSGVTVSVRVREVYVNECFGGTELCGWNPFGILYSYGPWSDADSIAATP